MVSSCGALKAVLGTHVGSFWNKCPKQPVTKTPRMILQKPRRLVLDFFSSPDFRRVANYLLSSDDTYMEEGRRVVREPVCVHSTCRDDAVYSNNTSTPFTSYEVVARGLGLPTYHHVCMFLNVRTVLLILDRIGLAFPDVSILSAIYQVPGTSLFIADTHVCYVRTVCSSCSLYIS